MVKCMLSTFMQQHNLPEDFTFAVEKYYKPISEKLYRQFSKGNVTYFVGINGCQGSGKSTLTDFIATYLTTFQVDLKIQQTLKYSYKKKRAYSSLF